jgi:hypothetical protein
MGALLGLGAGLIICLVIGLIVTVIALFFGHIILFDSIAFAILTVVLTHGLWNIHLAISIVIGIAVGIGLFFLQKTTVGFWILCIALSLLWGFIFSTLAYEISDKDMIWTYVIFGLGTLMMVGLHIRARRKMGRQ